MTAFILERLKAAMPVVDQVAFDAIECNRCGSCCEGFFLSDPQWKELGPIGTGPIGMLVHREYWRAHGLVDYEMDFDSDPRKSMFWLGGLEPWQDEEERWRYRCPHFERDEEGLGVCGIWPERPEVCSDFPYGKPQTFWPECSWAVELLDFDVVQGTLV